MQAQPPGGSSTGLIIMGLIMVVFWLFFIRPQAKKAKQQTQFTKDLQKGDKIVTTAGIHGRIYRLNDDGSTLDLELKPGGSTITIERSAVSMEMTAQVNKAAAVVTTDKK